MRNQVERLLMAANLIEDANERREYKQRLFQHLLENHPEVLAEMEHGL